METTAPKAAPAPSPAWPVPAASLGVTAVLAATLTAFGQRWWCKCNGWSPISLDTWSMHNSQHLIDAYTLSHVLHGFAFFGALTLLKGRLSMGWRFVVALVVETAWEIVENTPMVIDRYREVTVSLDYYGDSVLNSVSDLWACALGFAIAAKLPWWATALAFVAIELVMLAWIKDNLTLNVLMLIYPIDAIREWQAS